MPTLQEALDSFLKVDRSRITNRNYQSVLARMIEYTGAARQVKRVSFDDLLDFADTIRLDLSASTFRQYTIIIKVFFNWCVGRQHTKISPAAGLTARTPKTDPNLSRAVSTELLAAMIERTRHQPRNHALLWFLVGTGARRSAVATLLKSNLHLSEYRASVVEKGDRGCSVYFGDDTAIALSRWLAVRPTVDHDFVFTGYGKGDPLHPDSITAMVRRLSLECGGPVCGPHNIRHWVAEMWVESGAAPNDVQHKLNHSRVETTIRNYFPSHNRNVETLSKQLTLPRSVIQGPETPANIIPLDYCG